MSQDLQRREAGRLQERYLYLSPEFDYPLKQSASGPPQVIEKEAQ